ncbi:MAG TPA: hypothetical protein VEF35_10460 [Candidatus Bathyarchaeia archaeon]|nr:hypothetical protein [Candidatus Bathyarchaeia archaeon]
MAPSGITKKPTKTYGNGLNTLLFDTKIALNVSFFPYVWADALIVLRIQSNKKVNAMLFGVLTKSR